jgi:hypothetical protein
LEKVCLHSHFQHCLDELLEFCSNPVNKRLFLVVGVTGSGKTTLKNEFIKRLLLDAKMDMEADPEHIPFASINIKAPGPTAFSWKDPYSECLRELAHPFADESPLWPSADTVSPYNKWRPLYNSRTSNGILFRALQSAIRHRKPRALIFDEGQHFLRLTSSQSLRNQLEHLKFLADEMRTPIFIFGQYELMRFGDFSAQIVRRREVIHMGRYTIDPKNPDESLKAFAKVVEHFHRGMKDLCSFEFEDEVPNLYQGCVGCVGILQQWLLKAFHMSSRRGEKKISKQVLEQAMIPIADRKRILDEAMAGEERFSEAEAAESEYFDALGIRAIAGVNQPTKKAGKRQLPGRRKPHNDPVGGKHLDPKSTKTAA